jgi:hypothetical protein
MVITSLLPSAVLRRPIVNSATQPVSVWLLMPSALFEWLSPLDWPGLPEVISFRFDLSQDI